MNNQDETNERKREREALDNKRQEAFKLFKAAVERRNQMKVGTNEHQEAVKEAHKLESEYYKCSNELDAHENPLFAKR